MDMHTHTDTRTDRTTTPRESIGLEIVASPAIEPAALQRVGREEEFANMLRGFRRSGGVARGQDVASLLASGPGLNVGTLARWIVQGQVVYFDWQHETWLPMFQFGGADMAPRAGVRRVLNELRGVLGSWEIAHWFACPCTALGGRSPADTMGPDPDTVLEAARRDRYIVDA